MPIKAGGFQIYERLKLTCRIASGRRLLAPIKQKHSAG
jgi:hypothetical protein